MAIRTGEVLVGTEEVAAQLGDAGRRLLEADEATLDVLRLLARKVETVPALVVASYRDDELARAHPLWIMLGDLARSRTVGRMKLVRLSPGAVAQLAEPYGVDADELHRKTAGNPFFVVEALAAGVEGIADAVRDAVQPRRPAPPGHRRRGGPVAGTAARRARPGPPRREPSRCGRGRTGRRWPPRRWWRAAG
jgi:hypothetical protein